MPRLAIRTTELYYQLDGPAEPMQNPVLVLANGIFQRTEAWEPLMPHLQGFTVLRYDMRGQGQSAVPEGPYTPALHADDLEVLLQTLGIDNYYLLGLSNGGIVAQIHAIRQPRGLQKLILLCTTPRLDPLTRAKVESWQWALEHGGTRGRLQIALPWIWGRTFLESHPEINTPQALEQMSEQAPTLEAQKNLLAGFLTLEDLRPQLRGIRVPTLVLSGEEDLLFTPFYSQEIANAIPQTVHHVLPSVGHVAALENTALLAQEILSFLEVRA
ncbi:alpha/beta hydrolase [Meiothermus sp.]|uniref:alpha/beta fold hydrolase n=1 Tax=Meiothermus sp. TaxID=1955249 RepID=UPI00307DC975